MKKIEPYVERRNFGRRIDISLMQRADRAGQDDLVAKPLAWAPLEIDDATINPAIELDLQAAQSLMDQLWACGVRPTEGIGSAGQIGAVQDHLKDMRTIAFAALRKQGIE